MKLVFVISLVFGLAGCITPSLNSPSENHMCSEQIKPCGCAGMKHCCKGLDGHECCSKSECSCDSITMRNKDCSCETAK